MKKGSQYLIGAVIIVGAVDLFMANRVYLKKKGVVLRDMILTSLDETARGRGRSRKKDTRQDEQDAQQNIVQDEQDAQGVQQNIVQDEQDTQQNAWQDEQDTQCAQQSTQQDEQGAQPKMTPDPEDGKAARNSGQIVIE